MTATIHSYEVRPRKDGRGFDLISDQLPIRPFVVAAAHMLRRSHLIPDRIQRIYTRTS